MWRVFLFFKYRPGHSPERHAAWSEQSTASLLERLAGTGALRRALLHTATDGVMDDWSSGYDGALELRYDESRAAAAALGRLQTRDTLQALAGESLDLEASRAWLGTARPVLDKPGVKARLMVGAQVADGYRDREDVAQRYWRDVHPVVAQQGPEFWGRLLRYTQVQGVRIPGAIHHMPIAAEIGAASFEDLNAGFATDFYQSTVRPDELKFVRPEGMLVLACGPEQVVYERPGT